MDPVAKSDDTEESRPPLVLPVAHRREPDRIGPCRRKAIVIPVRDTVHRRETGALHYRVRPRPPAGLVTPPMDPWFDARIGSGVPVEVRAGRESVGGALALLGVRSGADARSARRRHLNEAWYTRG
jgi:hypothetical protein